MRKTFNLGRGRWLGEGAMLTTIGWCLGKGGSIPSPWIREV